MLQNLPLIFGSISNHHTKLDSVFTGFKYAYFIARSNIWDQTNFIENIGLKLQILKKL